MELNKGLQVRFFQSTQCQSRSSDAKFMHIIGNQHPKCQRRACRSNVQELSIQRTLSSRGYESCL